MNLHAIEQTNSICTRARNGRSRRSRRAATGKAPHHRTASGPDRRSHNRLSENEKAPPAVSGQNTRPPHHNVSYRRSSTGGPCSARARRSAGARARRIVDHHSRASSPAPAPPAPASSSARRRPDKPFLYEAEAPPPYHLSLYIYIFIFIFFI